MSGRISGRIREHRLLAWAVGLSLAVVLVTPLLAFGLPSAAAQTATDVASPEAVAINGSTGPCASGRMRVGDLPAIDPLWQSGLAAATKTAKAWQPDARLVEFQVLCQAFSAGFLWRGTFYSPSAQLLFVSDTGETQLTNADPNAMTELPTSDLSFTRLQEALVHAGYPNSAQLTAVGGVDIQLSTNQHPFGPPGSPRDTVYFHVAVDYKGQVQDLFVSASDSQIYRYQDVQ